MIRFVFDECMPEHVLRAVEIRNREKPHEFLDVVAVGDGNVLPKGTPDGAIIAWAEQAGRAIVTLDDSTMPAHLREHLAAGKHCLGVFCVRPETAIPSIVFRSCDGRSRKRTG